MKKIFLIMGLVAVLFCVAINVKAIDSAEDQNLLIQLQQQIVRLTQQIADIFSNQTAAISATSNCVHFVSSSGKGSINYVFLGSNKSATDYCSSSTNLVEYYCNSGSAFGKTKVCENGCQDGLCKTVNNPTICVPNWTCGDWSVCSNGQQSKNCNQNNCSDLAVTKIETQSCTMTLNTCTDSDNGKDYFTKGKTEYSTVSYTDACFTESYVKEYYCDANETGISMEYKFCDNGCQDGACKSSSFCTSNWQVGEWSTCFNGQQIRTVIDLNNCGTVLNKPSTSQGCSSVPTGSCVDSDVGLGFPNSLTVKGACTDKMGTQTDYSTVSDNGVHEFFCYQDACTSTNFNCYWQFGSQYPFSVGGTCRFLPPSVKIISPNGGEKIKKGETYQIKWKAENMDDYKQMLIEIRSSTYYKSILDIPVSAEFYNWTVPSDISVGGGYTIKASVYGSNYSDSSDNVFSIISPTCVPYRPPSI